MLTFPAWKQMRRYGCDGSTRAMIGNARRRALMAQVEARTEMTGTPCHYCHEDCFDDGGPEYLKGTMAVCYSCAELACRS